MFSPYVSTVNHGCESRTGVSEWPGWASSIPPLISINSPIYPPRLLSSWAPCWCCGWPGWPCCLWTGLRAAWPSPLPGLRAWGVASRETAETSGPTSSSSWLMTRMLSWVRLAYFLVFLEFWGPYLLFIWALLFLTFISLILSDFLSYCVLMNFFVFLGICIRIYVVFIKY